MSDIDLLELKKTSQFRKDLKRMIKRRKNIDLLDELWGVMVSHRSTERRILFSSVVSVSLCKIRSSFSSKQKTGKEMGKKMLFTSCESERIML